MGYYKVNFGDYCLSHHDDMKYFNYFDFKGKKYPIGAYVKLTKDGEWHMFKDRGYGFIRGGFRLVDHFIDDRNIEKWTYIIGKDYNSNFYYFHNTSKTPDELIDTVLFKEINETEFAPGELKITFKDENYLPKDWEVEGVMTGWIMFVIAWLGAFIFQDALIVFATQIGAAWYFFSWRDKKISEAISAQKFKK